MDLASLEGRIQSAMDDWEAPGLAIAVVQDDAVVMARGFGVVQHGGAPIDVRTVFPVGAVTRTFTASALAVLVDEGQLAWDDAVVRFLPGLKLADPYVVQHLTVRDLLAARAGLASADALWYGSGLSPAELMRRIQYLPLVAGFRAQAGSFALMYVIAGQLLQAVSGEPWDSFVRSRLLEPLGLQSSFPRGAEAVASGSLAVPHARINRFPQPVPPRNLDNAGAAVSLHSCAADLAEWMRMHLGDGCRGDTALLSSDAVREMQSPQVLLNESWKGWVNPLAHFAAYGLGWVLHDYHGRVVVEHGGTSDGGSALVALVPEMGIGLTLLCNMHGTLRLLHSLKLTIFDAMMGEGQRDWLRDFLMSAFGVQSREAGARVDLEESRERGTRPSLPLAAYSGTYRDPAFGEAAIRLAGERLQVRYGHAFSGEMEHWHHDTFLVTWSDQVLGDGLAEFVVELGRVVAVTLPAIATFERR